MGDLSKEEEEPYADNTATGSLVAVYPLSKVKTVFFIRHGQAAHNLAFESIGEAAYLSWENEDSRLTPTGISQAKAAATMIAKRVSGIERIFVSSLTRALETCQHALPKSLRCGGVTVLEDIRETHGQHPCNKRRCVTTLKKEFPEFNFSELTSEDDELYSDRRESPDQLRERAAAFLSLLLSQDVSTMAVVSHSDFLTALFSLKEMRLPTSLRGKHFANGEVVAVAMASA